MNDNLTDYQYFYSALLELHNVNIDSTDAFPAMVDYGALDEEQLDELRELAEQKQQEDEEAFEKSKKKKRRTLKVKATARLDCETCFTFDLLRRVTSILRFPRKINRMEPSITKMTMRTRPTFNESRFQLLRRSENPNHFSFMYCFL